MKRFLVAVAAIMLALPATAKQPAGRDPTFDYMACSAYYHGAAAYYAREGRHDLAIRDRELAEKFMIYIAVLFDTAMKNENASTRDTMAVTYFMRQKMELAITTKDVLERYNSMFWPLCSSLEDVVK